jgi:hypothetical protein
MVRSYPNPSIPYLDSFCIRIFKVGFLKCKYDEYHYPTHHNLFVSEFDPRIGSEKTTICICICIIRSYPIRFHLMTMVSIVQEAHFKSHITKPLKAWPPVFYVDLHHGHGLNCSGSPFPKWSLALLFRNAPRTCPMSHSQDNNLQAKNKIYLTLRHKQKFFLCPRLPNLLKNCKNNLVTLTKNSHILHIAIVFLVPCLQLLLAISYWPNIRQTCAYN